MVSTFFTSWVIKDYIQFCGQYMGMYYILHSNDHNVKMVQCRLYVVKKNNSECIYGL